MALGNPSLIPGRGLSLGGDLVVAGVESLGVGAVEVEPPVADEVLLEQQVGQFSAGGR